MEDTPVESYQKGTMIQSPRIGKRINILVLGHVDNDQIGTLIALLDKHHINSKIIFNHYGRPNKCKKMFDAWFTKYSEEDTLSNKMIRADEELFK